MPLTKPQLHTFHSPSTVIGRFMARRVMKGSVLWGGVFGLTVASSAIAYAGVYTTLESRLQLAGTFGGNIGLKAMIGAPYHLETVAGFTAWRSLGVITLVGAIWAILSAGKSFRGEEAAGRLELLLTGQTTMRRATANILAAYGVGLLGLYTVLAVITIAVGRVHTVQFSWQSSLFFALAATMVPAMFLAIGALVSQLQATRGRANAMTVAIFGLCFGLRAIGEVAHSTHWLIDISPIGWVEQLRPLTGSQPLWLLPIIGLIAVCSGAAIVLAGRRDLGASLIADNDTAQPRLAFLNTPLAAAWRLNRSVISAWCFGLFVMSLAFSSLAKTAGQAFSSANTLQQALDRLSQQSHIGATLFLGIIFLFLMTVIMLMVAQAVSKLRDDEAAGYLDNLLIRPISRLQLLGGRILIILASIVAGSVSIWLGNLLGNSLSHGTVTAHDVLLAVINTLPPACLMLGLGILALAFRPRLTAALMYGVVGWSFLVQILGSIGNINHYILDTSILRHVALSPVVPPNWQSAYIMVVLGLAAGIIGVWRFTIRDLEAE